MGWLLNNRSRVAETSTMGSNEEEIELIQIAIQRLIQDNNNKQQQQQQRIHDDDDDNNNRILLSTLLSQLESLKGDGISLHQLKVPVEEIVVISSDIDAMKDDSEGKNIDGRVMTKKDGEIVKELKKLKKQNTITHGLLSVLILLTLAWQLSQVSLIWKFKDRFSHPFRSIGDMFNGVFKPPAKINMDVIGLDKNASSSDKKSQTEVPSISPIKLPEFPNMDLSSLGLNDDK